MCKGPVMRTAECSWNIESEKEDARGEKDQTWEDPVGLTKSLVWETIERFQQVADQLMVW